MHLSPKARTDTTISAAFQIWMALYALVLAAGFLIASTLNGQTETLTPAKMQSGGLLFQQQNEVRFIEAPSVASHYDLAIAGPIARVKVKQSFHNATNKWQEGLYVFPLPDDAAVDKLRIKIGERIIEGQIQTRKKAKQLYEEAKQAGKKASLIEQQRPNLFTNAIANIGPDETIVVEIEYQQSIAQDKDSFSLRLPLAITPRYSPQSHDTKPVIHQTMPKVGQSGWSNGTNQSANSQPAQAQSTPNKPDILPPQPTRTNKVTITATLDPGFPLASIKSPYHAVVETRTEAGAVKLSLKDETIPADKDFVLTWSAKPGSAPQLGLFRQTSINGDSKNQHSYLLAYITPPYRLAQPTKAAPRDIIFVLDQSGSMSGESIEQAKASLIAALKQLTSQDKFQIIRFNNQMAQLFEASLPANEKNRIKAEKWVQQTIAEGGTEMRPAMKAALADRTPDSDRLRQVIFLTDGAITNEKELFQLIKSGKGRSRIFMVGIGSAPNSYFMSRASEAGQGTFTHIGKIDEVQNKMSALFEKLRTPIASNLAIKLKGAKKATITPAPLPDLYKNQPILIAIRAEDIGKTLTVTGQFNNQPWSLSVDPSKAAKAEGIAKYWARRKVHQLEAERLFSEDHEKIDQDITRLGLDHDLVTRLTSLVAIDKDPSRPKGAELISSTIPLTEPAGSNMAVDPMAMMSAPQASGSMGRKMLTNARPRKQSPALETHKQQEPKAAQDTEQSPEGTSDTTSPIKQESEASLDDHKQDRTDLFNLLTLLGLATLLASGFFLMVHRIRKSR